jgi:hypothetical protein
LKNMPMHALGHDFGNYIIVSQRGVGCCGFLGRQDMAFSAPDVTFQRRNFNREFKPEAVKSRCQSNANRSQLDGTRALNATA